MAQRQTSNLALKFARLSIATLAGGLMTACVGGLALASDSVAAGGQTTPLEVPSTPSVNTTTDSHVVLTGAHDVNVVSNQNEKPITSGPLNTSLPASSASETEYRPIVGVTSSATSVVEASSPVLTNELPLTKEPTIILASVVTRAVTPSPSTPAAQAKRQLYYRTSMQRMTESQSQDGSPDLPLMSPIVNDSGLSASSGVQNNGPLPLKTSGLLGALTLALGGMVMPNIQSNLLNIVTGSTAYSPRVLFLLILIATFIQGYILYIRRAGFIRAPRAGLGSPLTFATSPLISHFLPTKRPK